MLFKNFITSSFSRDSLIRLEEAESAGGEGGLVIYSCNINCLVPLVFSDKTEKSDLSFFLDSSS